jgi:hypothetical protein
MTEDQRRMEIEKKLGLGAWGLFFVWIGLAWMLQIPIAVGLLGVAAITLGAQAVRRAYGLALESFWIVVGLCFAVGGVWEIIDAETSVVPVLMIIAGGALLVGLFKRTNRRPDEPTK